MTSNSGKQTQLLMDSPEHSVDCLDSNSRGHHRKLCEEFTTYGEARLDGGASGAKCPSWKCAVVVGRLEHGQSAKVTGTEIVETRFRSWCRPDLELDYRLFSFLNLSQASFKVLKTEALIMRCSVVASCGI